jgi:hypothetical protein
MIEDVTNTYFKACRPPLRLIQFLPFLQHHLLASNPDKHSPISSIPAILPHMIRPSLHDRPSSLDFGLFATVKR